MLIIQTKKQINYVQSHATAFTIYNLYYKNSIRQVCPYTLCTSIEAGGKMPKRWRPHFVYFTKIYIPMSKEQFERYIFFFTLKPKYNMLTMVNFSVSFGSKVSIDI